MFILRSRVRVIWPYYRSHSVRCIWNIFWIASCESSDLHFDMLDNWWMIVIQLDYIKEALKYWDTEYTPQNNAASSYIYIFFSLGIHLKTNQHQLICYVVVFQLGYTPLHRAASKGHTEAIELLLTAKCSVDSQDEVIFYRDIFSQAHLLLSSYEKIKFALQKHRHIGTHTHIIHICFVMFWLL